MLGPTFGAGCFGRERGSGAAAATAPAPAAGARIIPGRIGIQLFSRKFRKKYHAKKEPTPKKEPTRADGGLSFPVVPIMAQE